MRKAFVVGLAEFEHQDLAAVSTANRDACDFFAHITDPRLGEADKDHSILMKSPTKKNLELCLASFLSSMTRDDHFIIYLRGRAAYLTSGILALECRDTSPQTRSLTSLDENFLRSVVRLKNDSKGIIIFDTNILRGKSNFRNNFEHNSSLNNRSVIDHEGLEIIWTGIPEVRVGADKQQGLFCSLLIDCMKSHSGKGPLICADAVNMIRDRFEATSIAESLWPSLRTVGDVSDLYLSKSAADFNTSQNCDSCAISTALQELAEYKTGDLKNIQQNLIRLAACVVKTATLPKDEPARILRSSRLGSVKKWFYAAVLGPIIWGSLLVYGLSVLEAYIESTSEEGLLFSFAYWIPILLMSGLFVIRSGNLFAEIFNPALHSLVVNRQGLIILRGRHQPPLIFEWCRVNRIYWRQIEQERSLVLSFSQKVNGRWEYAFNNVSYKGGLGTVANLITAYYRKSDALLVNFREAEAVGMAKAVNAVAISAVSDYSFLPKLSSPRFDSIKLSETVEELSGLLPSNSLNFDVEKFENWLKDTLLFNKDRTVLIYFSGHGIEKFGEMYLCLRDSEPAQFFTTCFSVSKLYDLAAETGVLHLVLVLDCCFSAVGGSSLGFSSGQNLSHLFEGRRRTITLLASAASNEEALGFSDGMSLFTSELVAELRQRATVGSNFSIPSISDALALRLRDHALGQHHSRFTSEVAADIALLPIQRSVLLKNNIMELAKAQANQLDCMYQKALEGSLSSSSLRIFRCRAVVDGFFDRDVLYVCSIVIPFGLIYMGLKFGTKHVNITVLQEIIIVVALIFAALVAVGLTMRKTKENLLLITPDGVKTLDLTVPSAIIGNVRLGFSEEPLTGDIPRGSYRQIQIIDLEGNLLVLAEEQDPWSEGIAEIYDAVTSLAAAQ